MLVLCKEDRIVHLFFKLLDI